MLPIHVVPFIDPGLVIALQYWYGDHLRAFRLARLIADIELVYRNDVTLVLAGRFDVDVESAFDTVAYCNAKMRTFSLVSNWTGTGHPDGAAGLWGGTMEKLSSLLAGGDLDRNDVFTIEADGCPLARDWIDRIKAEHERSKVSGRRVTGAYMSRPLPHINGSMVVSVPWWIDTPSLRRTPGGHAWDVFHRETLLAAAARSDELRTVYGARAWSGEQLGPLGKQASWLSSTKDDSAIAWAERTLVH